MLLKIAAVLPMALLGRFPWWRLSASLAYPRILMYHMIAHQIPGSKLNKWRIPPQQFAKHMHYLTMHGWQAMTMSELMSSDTVPEKAVVITFDDGFACVYDYAMPVLRDLGLKSTHYLLSHAQDNAWDAHKEVKRESLLSEKQIDTMLASGLVEVGVHGQHHRALVDMGYTEIVDELIISKETIEQRHGIQCLSLAYPYGAWHGAVVMAAKECGFDHAVAVKNRLYQPKHDHRFAIPRLTMDGRRSSVLDFSLRLAKG